MVNQDLKAGVKDLTPEGILMLNQPDLTQCLPIYYEGYNSETAKWGRGVGGGVGRRAKARAFRTPLGKRLSAVRCQVWGFFPLCLFPL